MFVIDLPHFQLQQSERNRGGRGRGGVGGGGHHHHHHHGGHPDDLHEFRVGRIKHERVRVPRGNRLLAWAMQVMSAHADRKAILEVEFAGEEGTGLGPTLEFFALVAAELQRKDLGMWICDDDPAAEVEEAKEMQEEEKTEEEVGEEKVKKAEDGEELSVVEQVVGDVGEKKKPPGYYVSRPSGLFPAPMPQDSELCAKASKLFWFLGVFLAKTLQDNRLVDLPLSYPFLKLLCGGEVSAFVREKSKIVHQEQQQQQQQQEDELMASSMYSALSEESDLDTTNSSYAGSCCSSAQPPPALGRATSALSTASAGGAQASPRQGGGGSWFSHLLGLEDLEQVDPGRGEFLRQLQELSSSKQALAARSDLSEEARRDLVDSLSVTVSGGHEVRPEDLALTFEYAPSSRASGFDSSELRPGGAAEALTAHNADEYVERTLEFALDRGIRRQMEALRAGFNRVFPLEKLSSFSPDEVRTMLCGDQCPVFTREEIIRFTEPKLGYSR